MALPRCMVCEAELTSHYQQLCQPKIGEKASDCQRKTIKARVAIRNKELKDAMQPLTKPVVCLKCDRIFQGRTGRRICPKCTRDNYNSMRYRGSQNHGGVRMPTIYQSHMKKSIRMIESIDENPYVYEGGTERLKEFYD